MIGRALQHLIGRVLLPLSLIRQSQQMGWDREWLADVEADHDAWERDELWLAHQRFTAGDSPRGGSATDSPPVVRAADADQPAQAFSVGGPLKSDEQVIEELVADYREFVRACFNKRS